MPVLSRITGSPTRRRDSMPRSRHSVMPRSRKSYSSWPLSESPPSAPTASCAPATAAGSDTSRLDYGWKDSTSAASCPGVTATPHWLRRSVSGWAMPFKSRNSPGWAKKYASTLRFGLIPRLRTRRGQHFIGIRVGVQISACGGQHTAGRSGQSTRRALVRRAGGGRRDGARRRCCQRAGGKRSGNSAAQRRSQDSHQLVPQLSFAAGRGPRISANVQPACVARRRI